MIPKLKIGDLSAHCYYPTEYNIKRYKDHITQKYKESDGWIELVKKNYDFSKFNGKNYKQLAKYKFNNLIKKDIEFIEETIQRLESAKLP